MPNLKWKQGLFMAAAVSLTMLGGCVVEENHPNPPPHVVYIQKPPPVEIVEEIPPHPPGPYWAWQKGHWRWNGHDYYWARGHWAERPPQYNAWVAPHWEPRNQGYFFVEGHWQ